MARRSQNQTYSRCPLPSHDPGQDRALAPDPEEPHPAGKTTSCQATSKPRSRPSSPTTTTADTTRASTISPRPTSTSDAALPSWQNEKGSNVRPSPIAACSTSRRRPEIYNPMRQSLPYFTQLVVSKTLTTDTTYCYSIPIVIKRVS